jgi:hypothetical protein
MTVKLQHFLSKLPSYRYEQEIRLVFGAHPAITNDANGVLMKIDGKTLVQDILISDEVPKDEADFIRHWVSKD